MRSIDELKQEAISNFKTAGPNYAHGMAILEVLLDIRDLLQHPPIEISGDTSQWTHDDGHEQPEHDELFEEAARMFKNAGSGTLVTTKVLTLSLGITQGRASDLREALLDAGVLKKEKGTNRYKVV